MTRRFLLLLLLLLLGTCLSVSLPADVRLLLFRGTASGRHISRLCVCVHVPQVYGKNDGYFPLECTKNAEKALPGRVNITTANLPDAVAFSCNVVSYCGFPQTNNASEACVLGPLWAPQPVPTTRASAVCTPFGRNLTACDRLDWVNVRTGGGGGGRGALALRCVQQWSCHAHTQQHSQPAIVHSCGHAAKSGLRQAA